ncbi:unannotated protein [freshwater metagenome]|uniref:Unannotated protein n=1 Tax=freshwater metagenome TaxID=449393 RepID=A0A6J7I5I1_9ZZZZ|nr:hypothetical protein [Actinomycetota bacterium]
MTDLSAAPDRTAPLARVFAWNWPLILLVALIGVVIAGTVVYPTYSNYDTTYSLLWGRELLQGDTPSFEAYRAPTQHPLAVLVGAVFSLFGYLGDRLFVLLMLAAFVVLVMGLYRLGRSAFTTLVGLIAAVIVCTRFDFPFLAARGYIDVPFLALVIWAAVLEVERPRRGRPVLWLLMLAGLLRPEAWVLSGIYWLWLLPRRTWRERLGDALIVASAPLIWAGLDYGVTGDPLYSQNHTSGLAEELGRSKGVGEVPHAMVTFMRALVKLPVAIAGIAGIGIAAVLAPSRLRVPLALILAGLLTFVMVGAAGLSVISRYLLAPSLMVMVFAAVAIGGWTMLAPSRLRTGWMVVAGLAVVFAVTWTALRVNVSQLTTELRQRGDARVGLKHLLDQDQVKAALACGPVLTPNHRLIGDVRWIMDLPEGKVIARSDTGSAAGIDYGLAIVPAWRARVLRQGFDLTNVTVADTLAAAPPPGWKRIGVSEFYAAYARCPTAAGAGSASG